ncbi:MAG: HMA2 domain-containing protein [Syntrophobacteraceae bacterium]
MISTNYFHAIDGRMRLGIPGVKGSWAKAQELKDRIINYQGINDVRPNPTTGNVLITYDPQRISQYDILKSLYELGYLQDCRSIAAGLQAISAGGSDWGSALVRVALETLLTALML